MIKCVIDDGVCLFAPFHLWKVKIILLMTEMLSFIVFLKYSTVHKIVLP